MAKPLRIPAYRLHKPKNLGVVRLNGRDIDLGPYDSAAFRALRPPERCRAQPGG